MTEWALSMFVRRQVINNGLSSNAVCNHTSDLQNQRTTKCESDLPLTSMVTDRIGWLKVLLPINHNSYNFWKQQIHSDKYVLERQCLSGKFLNFWKFHNFPRISGCCYGYCDQFCDWWIWLKGLSMVGCFNCQIAGVWLQPIIRLQLYRIFSEE